MTCRLSESNWLDVLYACVSRTDGKVEDAARFLTERRGKRITPQSLRNKLRGLEGESMNVEMAHMLSEWMESKAGGKDYANDWLIAFGASRGISFINAAQVAPMDGQELAILVGQKLLAISGTKGILSMTALAALSDRNVCGKDADSLLPHIREIQKRLGTLEQALVAATRAEAAHL